MSYGVTRTGGLEHEDEWREGWQKGVQERLWGGTASTKSHLRGPMETYYRSSSFQYMQIWKKSKRHHQITGKTKPQVDQTSSAKNGLYPVELLDKEVPLKSPNNLVRWVALSKLKVEPHCLGQHPHNSLNMEKSGWLLQKAFTSKCQHLWYRKVFCMLPKEKHKHHL